MLRVFRRAGFDVSTRFDDGVIQVDLHIAVTPQSVSASAARQSSARARSMARLLRPSSVAIVGASRRPGSIGSELVRQLIAGGFQGSHYFVNHAAEEIRGEKSWSSLSAIGQPVELAIVAVPAEAVGEVAADAVEAGVGALLIVSSGFSETGPAGAERERQLVTLARNNGMRIVGPNAFGMVNTSPEVGLRALFLPLAPREGSVAMVSQSGPLGAAVLDHLTRHGVGLSSFVAVGNRADVSVNDLLDYWRGDTDTNAVLLYVENFGNLRTFARLARAVSLTKPVIAVRPAQDHLIELLAQAGVIVVDGVAEAGEVAGLLAKQPAAQGPSVAVVTNAASVGRLAAAACRRNGLEVVVPEGLEQYLAVGQADGAVLVDNLDSISGVGEAPTIDWDQILVTVAVASEVDSVLIAVVPSFDLSVGELGAVIDRVNRSIQKPVVATGLVGADEPLVEGVPVFAFPEDAARALGHAVCYATWRREAEGLVDSNHDEGGEDGQPEPIRQELTERLSADDETVLNLLTPEAQTVLDLLQVPIAPWRVVSDPADLDRAATEIGYPVALKAGSGDELMIGEAGGVAIDLHDRTQLEGAFGRMARARPDAMATVIVQVMVPSVAVVKVELIQDRALGAFVVAGIGGRVGTRIPAAVRRYLPVTPRAVEAMIDAMATTVAIDGDTRAALARIIDRLALLGEAVPELARVCLDPLLLAGSATVAVDVEVVIRRWSTDPLSEVRRL